MVRPTVEKKSSKLAALYLFLTLFFGGVNACVTLPPPPIEQYTLARAAIDAAKAVDAARYSPGYFHKAELAYRTAQTAYEDRDYETASEEFRSAREYAEKAENSARLTRFKNGEVL